MRALSTSEAKKWCQGQGAQFAGSHFPKPRTSKSFDIPEDAGRRVALVAEQLDVFRSGTTLVWFDDWSVWPSGQRMHIFERMRASYGEVRPLIEQPAFLFAKAEYEDMVSFVTIGVLFLWDVHVIGAQARRLLYYSHDEFGWISA